jgi:fatty-acyl-CoA synthase
MSTLTDRFAQHLREAPRQIACHLVDGEGRSEAVTWERLMGRAMAWASRFGTGRKLVAVCMPHGFELHAAFLGALWAGHVPTMLAPPSPRMEPAKYASSFARLLAHVRPDFLVVDAATHAALGRLAPAAFIDPAEVTPATCPPAPTDAGDVALVQHSSGTTGLQKGVALSHRAILAHQEAYAERLALRDSDVIVSWLPLYHDMGLIACFLMPLLARIPFVELSPFDWVKRPRLLFDKIAEHRATLCFLPNFAYSFLADSVRDADGLDLRSIRAFVNCSEPVLARSHDAFLRQFAAAGVSARQLTASYAMAENVFAVTQSRELKMIDADRRILIDEQRVVAGDSLRLVSNGAPLPTTEVRVLGPDGALPDGHVGELALRGAHLFSGYFGRDPRDDGWFLTGDLGFVKDGEVYVTGRKKDLIVIQGRNFHPSDFEEVASQVPGVTAGRVVAFGVADEKSGTERLVILVEIEEQASAGAVALAIRREVAQELDCTPSDVRVVPARWLVKSTSGKLARDDNRRKYLAG